MCASFSHILFFAICVAALTTKGGLASSLARLQRFSRGKLPLHTFWPRCYSLSSAGDLQKFEHDFSLSSALVTLKQYLIDYMERGESAIEPAQIQHGLGLWQARIDYLDSIDSPKKASKASEVLQGTPRSTKLLNRVQRVVALASQDKEMQDVLNGEGAGNNIWIVKPTNLSRGRRIALFSDLAAIKAYVKERFPQFKKLHYIAMKYIERPLLYEGRKFDIRQWVLVTGTQPLRVWFYDLCYLRLCSTLYDPEDISNKMVHLTNNSIQKHGGE